jgi:predicted acyl esterase
MITISTSGRNALLCMLLFLSAFTLQAHKKSPPLNVPKVSRLGVYQGYSTKTYQGYDYFSKYIPMRDSVMLAADIYLPKKMEKGKKVPTLLYLTRYVRSIRAKFPLSLVKDPVFGVVKESEIEFFTSFGYACVVVDVRGTGASQGERKMEFSPEEIADGNDVVNWIVKQTWSDKNVGALVFPI